jgi:4-hydroxythreonine-4-phosphate dehydrogenase
MKPLAVTCGDPAGVGPEILAALAHQGALENCVVFGPDAWLRKLRVEGVSVGPSYFQLTPGKPSPEGAQVALEAMEGAASACRQGLCAAAVTGPVSKAELAAVGFEFPGQTEFFASRWEGIPVMAFEGERLRVVLATWHIPLSEVGPRLEVNPSLLDRAVRAADRLARAGGVQAPRLALCGLNPHAGEGGLLGVEELDFLGPQATQLQTEFPGLTPPLPGDTVFWRMLRGEFDAVVALYHDQGLAPLKTLEFDRAVNVTLGLPWIRTSPDHGTAFALAGKGEADVTSFRRALEVARRLA